MREYRLVSADSHIVEPPDLFVDRVPAALKQRAPHQIREERGDAWVVEGAPEPFPFGLNSCGGLPPEAYSPWIRWEDVRPACYEPAARLGEMDDAGVDAEVLYPTPRIHNFVILGSDPELQLASVRAYNDYISEDAYGIRNRHEVGVDRILWSSDYPHATCDHPRYQAAIESDFAGVPEDELQKMLASNAVRVYGWGETS